MSVFYYAGVVDYISGTVVWSLDWVETSPGIIPYIDNTGLPQGKVGIVFTDPVDGGATGTLTVTATVNGLPAVGGITAVVPEPPAVACCWIQSALDPSTINLFHFNDTGSVYADSAQPPRDVTSTAEMYQSPLNSFCGNSLYLGSNIGDNINLSEYNFSTFSGITYEFSIYNPTISAFGDSDTILFEATLRDNGGSQAVLRGIISQSLFNPTTLVLVDVPTFSLQIPMVIPNEEWTVFGICYNYSTNTLTVYKNGINMFSQNMDGIWGPNGIGDQTPATFSLKSGSHCFLDEYRSSNQELYTGISYDPLYPSVGCAPILCSYMQSRYDACTTNLWHFNGNAGNFIYDELTYNYGELFGDISQTALYVFCQKCLYLGTANTEYTLAQGYNPSLPIESGVTFEFALLNPGAGFYYGRQDLFTSVLADFGEGQAQLHGYLDYFSPATLVLAWGYFDPALIEIPLTVDTWMIIAISVDYAAKTIMVYVNGTRVLIEPFDSSSSPISYPGSFTLFTGSSIYFDEFRRSKTPRYSGASYDPTMIPACTPTPAPPFAFFDGTFPVTNNVPSLWDFTDTSWNNPTSWAWDFGDGSPIDNTQNPSHTYTVPGTYTVSMTATNAYGSSTQTKIDMVTVYPPATDPLYTWVPTNGSLTGASIVGMSNEVIQWNTFGSGNFIYARTATPISGKTYCEFSTYTGPGLMYSGFGVQENPINLFYVNNPNGGSIFSRRDGTSGCGLGSAGFYNGSVATNNASYSFTTNIIGIAFDPATRRLWFSIDGVWVSGDPATNTAPTMTLAGGSTFYFTMGAYSCNVTSTFTGYQISPNLLTQAYTPPAGFSRYQP
jgi:PKD repeat protein